MNTPKINGKSLNPQEELLQQLKEQFPEVFSEGKIDPDKLKQTLGEQVSSGTERYGLNWAGKSNVFREIQKTTSATLVPLPEESVNFDTTKNLFIEGDNLEVLRILQRSYYGKIKMIYIDPPYNTGNDFIYDDNFKQDKTTYEAESGQRNGNGDLLKDTALRRNTRDNGHYHSDWLNMMYPRLFLARNLLRRDGVIFVSIDDNEVANLRLIMDEIFGEENFVGQLVWKNKYGAGAKTKGIIGLHEYVLLYARDFSIVQSISVPMSDKLLKIYNKRDEKFDKRGSYGTWPLETTSMADRPNLKYPIIHEGEEIWPKKQWLWSRERAEKAQKNNELVFNKSKNGSWSVRFKGYLKDESGVIKTGTPTSIIDDIFTQDGTADIKELFPEFRAFDFPKPVKLISRLLSFSLETDYKFNGEDIILDFFAGSGTTAQGVYEFNRGSERKYQWILVQLAENISDENEARKKGFLSVSDIAVERIRRFISNENNLSKQLQLKDSEKSADLGFKLLKLQDSNFGIWNQKIVDSAQLAQQLELSVENTQPDANQSNLLYELILKSGLELTEPVKRLERTGVTHFVVGYNELVVCLEGTVTRDFVDYLEQSKPIKVIFLERVFANNDDLKTNTILNLERADIDFKVA